MFVPQRRPSSLSYEVSLGYPDGQLSFLYHFVALDLFFFVSLASLVDLPHFLHFVALDLFFLASLALLVDQFHSLHFVALDLFFVAASRCFSLSAFRRSRSTFLASLALLVDLLHSMYFVALGLSLFVSLA